MNENVCISIKIIEVCSQGSNWQYSSIASHNGLALNQSWLVYWRIYASLGHNELNGCCNIVRIAATGVVINNMVIQAKIPERVYRDEINIRE